MNFKQNYFTLRDNRKLAYQEWGDSNNEKSIICVHGLTRNSRDFDYLAEALSKDYRIICPDIAGRGKSDPIGDMSLYNNQTYSTDIAELLQNIGIIKTYWVGTSMGGLIGIIMAALYPKTIERMVINDIGPFIPGSSLERLGTYVGKDQIFQNHDAAKAYIKQIFAPWGISKEEHWDHIVKNSLRETIEGFKFHYDPNIGNVFLKHDSNEPLKDVSLWELWDKVKCPVLVLRGMESDLLNRETASKMILNHTDSRLIEFPGIGHVPSLMEYEHIEIIREFLYPSNIPI